jgi:NNP family nitrate/nitrite transporter-like MFS transporter
LLFSLLFFWLLCIRGQYVKQNEKDNHYLLKEWRQKMRRSGKIKASHCAKKSLHFSSCLLLAFCVWMLFSAVAVNLNKVGFNFTTDQLFY